MRPWIKLWRTRSPQFMALGPVARGIFYELLLTADEDGCIPLGSRTPTEAINLLIGGTAGDRRIVKRVVATLLDDGCLVHDEGLARLSFPGWERFQTGKRRARTRREPSTNVTRTEHEPSTNVTRTVHEKPPKPPEPFKTGRGEEIKKREDKEEKRCRGLTRTAEEGGGARAPGPRHGPLWVWRIFSEACDRGEVPLGGLMNPKRRSDCEQVLELLKPDEVLAEVEAFVLHVSDWDEPPGRPWLRFLDEVGQWRSKAERASKRQRAARRRENERSKALRGPTPQHLDQERDRAREKRTADYEARLKAEKAEREDLLRRFYAGDQLSAAERLLAERIVRRVG